ncbi:SusC/RagA family TonB-linked outer membrane protein [Pararcticibacter amylolyticus]|uniref:SusC/RagA family TonB-linked outer membrane protein n=2 Tax=Pararcticibacter amylolyticus TaxID=2173175 RepID=A0A2U2PGM2_9SPHI|nr:SusC/RagA family TonB-linked outer membrane protein [Pararcticibacter amylolyticus]
MEYYAPWRSIYKISVLKILLIMKLILFFLLIAILHVSASTFGQKINLQVKNAPMQKVLDEISLQSGYNFLYSDKQLSKAEPVSVDFKNLPLNEALERVFYGQRFAYTITLNTIVVKPSHAIKKEAADISLQKVVTGTVFDEAGVTLPGVTIKIEGTERGAVSDKDGKYTIQVNSDADVLIFSFIGCITQKVVIKDRKVLDIKLLPNADNALQEVSVVAFGVQKKESVIGSITTVKPGELRVPSSNLTGSLAGRVAGIISYQRSGEPGADNADFFVRGITTFGNNTRPLILIDGIELTATDLARMQPDDIATFSVMKDATATSLYGARGANGVILVTTKQGAVGKAKISLRLENSISSPTRNVELADPVTYMKLANEAVATRNPLNELPYSEEKIANTGAGINPLVYPANDWRKMLFKDYALNQRFNLNVSGGGNIARYYVAGAFNNDNGVLKVDQRNNFNSNINLKSYSMRANVNINLTKSTELIVRMNGNFDDYRGPLDGGKEMYGKVMRSNPVRFPAYYPIDDQHSYVKHIMFGNSGEGAPYLNPYADMVKGYKDNSRSQMLAQFELKQGLNGLTKGLSFRTMLNLTRLNTFGYLRQYAPFYYQLAGYDILTNQYNISQINTNGREYLDFHEDYKTVTSTFYSESALNYNRTFAKNHDVGGLLVFITRESLNANAGSLIQSLPSRNLGLSGRATYSFKRKYFAEFNFGYNGSERFSESNRFGFFPSAGLAWSVSNEKFFEPLVPVVSNLRLRYTYGLVGNDQIGDINDRFFYMSNVNMDASGRSARFGRDFGEVRNGVFIDRYANPNISWEKSTKQNIAMELGLFGKSNIIAEYFTEDRDNILMSRASIPSVVGLSNTPRANVGKASGKGLDISMDYSQSWSKNLWLSVRGNLTYAKSRYQFYEEPEYKEYWRSRVGYSLSQQFGFIAERLFVDDQEAANSPRQFGDYGGGDIKYLDVNNDGKIDDADRVPIGNPTTPEVVYGFGFSLKYKDFDFSAFAQGAANQSFWIDQGATSPFNNQTQLLKAYADSHWSEENRNLYAVWPRLSPTLNANNNNFSTWWMRNASFLRLKQVEVGYTLPRKLLERIEVSNLRIYLSGSNLLMLSKFKMWDSEMAGDGLGYPLQKVFNAGINLTFN